MKFLLTFLFSTSFVFLFAQNKLEPLDKDLLSVTYPYEVTFHPVNSQRQDLKMAYLDVVPEQANGRTIVLLHGKNFNAAYWEQTIQELTKKGFRVIAPDQIGFGKSTKPEHYQYSFQDLASNTKSILDSLQITKIILLGHSMGGMLATRFSLMYPEIVEKLILENPIGLEDYKALAPYQTLKDSYKNELRLTAEDYRNYQLTFYYDNQWKPQYDPWLNVLAGWTLHPDYPIVAWNAALTTDMIFTQPVVYEFKNITCPTLLIIGTRDRTAIGKDRANKTVQPTIGLYHELGKKTQQVIPNATLVEFEHVGHLPHIEVFDKFIAALTAFIE